MFTKKQKDSYRNNWYSLNLQLFGEKLHKRLDKTKNYEMIPFGKSFLSVYWDTDKRTFTMLSKTLSKGHTSIVEHKQSQGNFGWNLQDYHFKEQWDQTDDKLTMTPEILKTLAENLSQLIKDIMEPDETILIPFYQYMIKVGCRYFDESNNFVGSIYIVDYYDEYSTGGSIYENNRNDPTFAYHICDLMNFDFRFSDCSTYEKYKKIHTIM